MRQYYLLLLLMISYGITLGNIYVVDSNGNADDGLVYTAGNGANTLRKCVRLANANAGLDTINFNIVGSTVITNNSCSLFGWLDITSPVRIDGYTQSGSIAGTPTIELNGAGVGCWYGINLTTGSAGSEIRGLIIYGTLFGIRMDSNTSGNTVAGCWIGVNNTGNAAATSTITQDGIRIEGSDNNAIGGSGGLIDRNVIGSCGLNGINFDFVATSNNTIQGNNIGVGANGITKVSNFNGVAANVSKYLTIGGSGINDGNVISGNLGRGIFLTNVDSFTIQGNIIGLGADTTTAADNTSGGIDVSSGSDVGQIGGSGAHERNYVSGNFGDALKFDDCNFITIQGNYMGLQGDGVTAAGNVGSGIAATNCEFMKIGGEVSGEGNVIANNFSNGISIASADSRNATIQGNIIGISADGATISGNFGPGISLNETEDSQIGGTALAARNVIGNNFQSGIFINNSPRTVIENNYIGLDPTGLIDHGNWQSGIVIQNSRAVVVGGLTRASRNIISGNAQQGILVENSSRSAVIKANFVGIAADGVTAIPNEEHGIVSQLGADSMTVGGPTAAERNVLSGNGRFVVNADPDEGLVGDGVRMLGTNHHLIQNNYIGTDSTGRIGVGNHWAGVSINDDSDSSLVIDNIISDNRNEGVWLYNGSDDNEFYRNVIGESATGLALGNWDFGVHIDFGGTSGNIFGGSLVNANIIAHTRGERPSAAGDAVTIASGAGDNNNITFNSIHCNAGAPIVRVGTSNSSQSAPAILASSSNVVSGTGDNGRTVHVYRAFSFGTFCDCEGEIYVGSTIVSGGTWSLTHNLNLTGAEAGFVTATQTTSSGSTSALAPCFNPLLSAQILDFNAELKADGTVLLNWASMEEANLDFYRIQRSPDGETWQAKGQVISDARPGSLASYSFVDYFPELGQAGKYYRLELISVDGRSQFSNTIFISEEEAAQELRVFPNPTQDEIHVRNKDLSTYELSVYNLLGVKLDQNVHIELREPGHAVLDLSRLEAGTYLLNWGSISRKIVKY